MPIRGIIILSCPIEACIFYEREKQIAQKRARKLAHRRTRGTMKAFLFRLAVAIKDFGERKRKPWLIRLGLKLKWRVMQ